MMRVLVTGGAGWIGSAVVATLKQQGHEPVVFDRSTGDDVTDLHQVNDAVSGVDAVINLAGVLGTAETVESEAESVRTNIAGAVNVYTAARDIPVVQIGTGHRGQLNPYAITKACAEDLGLSRAVWLGQQIVVVRAFHAYGPGQKMCPPHGVAKVRKVIPSFVCRALSGQPLEVWGSGRQVIDLVHVDDVALVLVEALHCEAGSVIDAGTGVGTTVYDAAVDVIAATRSASRIVHRVMRQGEPAESRVVAGNPRCPNPWPYGLDATVGWYRDALALA